MTSAPLLAQAADPITGGLLQYGAIGLVAAMATAVAWKLYGELRKVADLERDRADRREEEIKVLRDYIQDKTLTTLAEASRVLAEAVVQMRADDRAREDRR